MTMARKGLDTGNSFGSLLQRARFIEQGGPTFDWLALWLRLTARGLVQLSIGQWIFRGLPQRGTGTNLLRYSL